MATSVGGFYERQEERTPFLLTISPHLALFSSHWKSFARVKVFWDFPK